MRETHVCALHSDPMRLTLLYPIGWGYRFQLIWFLSWLLLNFTLSVVYHYILLFYTVLTVLEWRPVNAVMSCRLTPPPQKEEKNPPAFWPFKLRTTAIGIWFTAMGNWARTEKVSTLNWYPKSLYMVCWGVIHTTSCLNLCLADRSFLLNPTSVNCWLTTISQQEKYGMV